MSIPWPTRSLIALCLGLIMATAMSLGCTILPPTRWFKKNMYDPARVVTNQYEQQNIFPYVASEEKRSRLFKALAKVDTNWPIEHFIEIAGPPDFCGPWWPKLMPPEGLCLEYYLYMKESLNVKEGIDISVGVYFDLDGRFDAIMPNDIEELRARLAARIPNASAG